MIFLLLLLGASWSAAIDAGQLREAAELIKRTAATIPIEAGEVRRSRSAVIDGHEVVLSVEGQWQKDTSIKPSRFRLQEQTWPDKDTEQAAITKRNYELSPDGRLTLVQETSDLVRPVMQRIPDEDVLELGQDLANKAEAAFKVKSWVELVGKVRREARRSRSPVIEMWARGDDSENLAVFIMPPNYHGPSGPADPRACPSVQVTLRVSSKLTNEDGSVWVLCADEDGTPRTLDHAYTRLIDRSLLIKPTTADEARIEQLFARWRAALGAS